MTTAPAQRKPYSGRHRKLVMSFDLGTTFSGISYSILDPGIVPEINGVTRFPFQDAGSDAKIPTIMYYDAFGNLRAVGAETQHPSVEEAALAEGWMKYCEFKLHFGPQTASECLQQLSPLKEITTLFADFYTYLYTCAKSFVQETHHISSSEWSSLEGGIHFVLAHPNGWEGEHQNKMRDAMIAARLISNGEQDHSRVSFVTEGEASLHFCLNKGLSRYTSNEDGVIIVDAGGGTVDISTYSRAGASESNRCFEEITIPQCRLSGSVFVTRKAQIYLQDKLKGTSYAEMVDTIADYFDKTAKLRFRNAEEPAYIQFGTIRDNDPALGIRGGRLALPGSTVAGFFEPSLNDIIQAINYQRLTSPKNISAVFLVGGFAASNFIYAKLRARLQSIGIQLSRPDSHVNKAVADGAVSFYIDHAVNARMSRYNFGGKEFTSYEESIPEHRHRSDKAYIAANGELSLGDQFEPILPKGILVSETTEFRRTYHMYSETLEDLTSISDDIICYRGSKIDPRWMDTDEVLCTITADTQQAAKTLKPQRGPDGRIFYRLDYDVVLLFGLTELQAYCVLEGREKRQDEFSFHSESLRSHRYYRRGPARIIYSQHL
ncbi:uncharacterized protein EV420DRAFT_1750858 [Desarmillaria tabescens]|uniref:Actin-like ATPase domain-containing protein n=1 Tax=Armillaria tabescens TaxID=1929756 RepID=A0AA39MWP0_ARMTA|nr:uncharacterized protein EV420DRAFT_1750858 [Desarmillaria tabescens]KAK0448968.1 hypothetical protein EV420DRAFT_1750858 [Desarmillaria tabescens]